MTAAVAEGGLGWDAAKAGPIYGLYTALVYLTALPGGWIADRLLGQRRSVLLGGIIIALGHVSLTFHSLGLLLPGAVPDRHRHRFPQAQHQRHGRRPLHPRGRAARRRLLDVLHGDQHRRLLLAAGRRLPGAERPVPRLPRQPRHQPREQLALGVRRRGGGDGARPRPVRPRRPPPRQRGAAAGGHRSGGPCQGPAQPADRDRRLRGPGRRRVPAAAVDLGRHPLRRLLAAGDPDRLLRLPVQPARGSPKSASTCWRSWRSSSSPACSGPPSSRGARRSTCSPSASRATRSWASSSRRAGCSR